MTKLNKQRPISCVPGVLHLPPIPAEFINITYKCPNEIEKHNVSASPTCILPFASSGLFALPIQQARLLTSGEDVKTVIELSLDNKDALLSYKPGDTIGVLPQNPDEEVNYIIKRLNLTDCACEEYTIRISEANGKKKPVIPTHVPLNGTIIHVLQRHIDLRSVLKKVFICALSTYTEDPVERRCLEEISSREGGDLYAEQILNKNTSLLDILNEFPSCNPPITLLMQHLPRLMPRPYSVCNSPLVNKNIIKMCFSVVTTNNNKKGITTGWLEDIVKRKFPNVISNLNDLNSNENKIDLLNTELKNLEISESGILIGHENLSAHKYNNYITTYLRKSNSFCLPEDHSVPIIMIGVGTGVAPFIGFLEERRELKKINPDTSFGNSLLYFGCRYAERDFIFKDELNEFISDGTLTRLVLSHSRDDTFHLKYVQDGMGANAEELVNLIFEENATIYICGDINKTSKEITECLKNIFVKDKNMSSVEAETTLKNLKNCNRFIQDIWS